MTSRPLVVDGRPAGFVCSRGPASRPCAYCRRPSSKLCDGAVGEGRTCDRAMCAECTYSDGPDRDLCRQHRPASFENPGGMTMPFGKHRGQAIENIPSDYLRWCLENLEERGPDRRALLTEMANQLKLRAGEGVSRGRSEP